jgi:hypothetical protein
MAVLIFLYLSARLWINLLGRDEPFRAFKSKAFSMTFRDSCFALLKAQIADGFMNVRFLSTADEVQPFQTMALLVHH